MKPANNAPVYASIYRELAEVFRHFGYALAIHGSLARDFDLIAVPWSESPASPQAVIAEIEQQFALKATGELTDKPHGRKCQTMVFAGGDTFLDLSFMPVNPDCPQCWGEGEEVRECQRLHDVMLVSTDTQQAIYLDGELLRESSGTFYASELIDALYGRRVSMDSTDAEVDEFPQKLSELNPPTPPAPAEQEDAADRAAVAASKAEGVYVPLDQALAEVDQPLAAGVTTRVATPYELENGWIKHDGNGCPVAAGTRIQVRRHRHNGFVETFASGGDGVDWRFDPASPAPGDVTHWRLDPSCQQEQPLAAGDWVVCVDRGGCLGLKYRTPYKVERLDNAGDVKLVGVEGFYWQGRFEKTTPVYQCFLCECNYVGSRDAVCDECNKEMSRATPAEIEAARPKVEQASWQPHDGGQ